MKRRTRVSSSERSSARRSRPTRIASLRASVEEKKQTSRDLLSEVGNLYRPIKQPVTLRLDADVIAWFKKQGRGYQTRINRALRKLMLKDRGAL